MITYFFYSHPKSFFSTMCKNLIFIPILFLQAVLCAIAQPSNDQVKKDAIGNGLGVIDFKFTKNTGTRQWNSDVKNWEYVRGVVVKRKSDYAEINLIVSGDVVYQQTGNGGYSYWKFRIVSNTYEGIPNPTQNEILALINDDPSRFFGYQYGRIIHLITPPKLSSEPKWIWHKPTSVEFHMTAKYETILSNRETEVVEQIFKMRLYRDDIKGPWKNWNAHTSNNTTDKVIFEKKTYQPEKLSAMKTLQFTYGEKMASQRTAALPKTTIPDFQNFKELSTYTHQLLREGSAEQMESFLMQTLAPRFFVNGSSTQLNQEGESLVKKVIDAAYKHDITYKMLYCAEPNVNKGVSSDRYISLQACVQNVASTIGGDVFNAGYVEGRPVQKWKISQININMRFDNEVRNFLQSFLDRRKLCPND